VGAVEQVQPLAHPEGKEEAPLVDVQQLVVLLEELLELLITGSTPPASPSYPLPSAPCWA